MACEGKGKGRGKGSKGKGKWKSKTARAQAAEYDWSSSAADPERLHREGAVSAFLHGVDADLHPLDLEGTLFFRGKSLVSQVLMLPLKMAKQARHGLASASQGGLRSAVFFELPMVSRLQTIIPPHKGAADDPRATDEPKEPSNMDHACRPAVKLDSRIAQATLVLSTQQESDAAIADVESEVRRLASDALRETIQPVSKSVVAAKTNAHSQSKVAVLHEMSSTAEEDAPNHLSVPGDLYEILLSRMNRQRKLHQAFEHLLNGLRLDNEEAAECEQRGLPPRIANKCMMRTWRGGLLRGVPFISDSGEVSFIDMRLREGLLIPARNVEGLITGLQFRGRTADVQDKNEDCPRIEDDSVHGEGPTSSGKPSDTYGNGLEHPESASPAPRKKRSPKYLWVSKDKSVKGDAGVLPFFCVCCRWSCREHTVALVEGGLKAYAFAFLARRFPVIGAAGGQWHQCGQPLLHALARLSARQVLLFVDAGAVLNRSVLLDYLRSLQLLKLEWGVDVHFAWWEQAEKGMSLDCDDQLLALRKEGRFSGNGSSTPDQTTILGSQGKVDEKSLKVNRREIQEASTCDARALEAAKLTPTAFWAKVPEALRIRLTEDKCSRDLLQKLQPLLDEALSSVPMTHRRR